MIGETQTLLAKSGSPEVYEPPAEDEDSFRTPLNHAGIYGLFLVSELAGQRLDPLTQWALSWISDLAQEHPEPPEGENAPDAPHDFIADIQGWVTKLIEAAQERGGSLAGGFDQASLDGHEAARTISLDDVANLLEGSDVFQNAGDADHSGSAVNTDELVALENDSVRPLHTLLSNFPSGDELIREDGDEGDASSDGPQAEESDAAVEENCEDTLVAEANTDPLTDATSTESFAFTLGADPATAFGTSVTEDVRDPAVSTTDIDPLDTPLFADQLVADPLADRGIADSGALPDMTLASQPVSSFITADDFIV